MPQYLAKYTVNADMFDGGAWMPDPEPHKPEYIFSAKDDDEARRLAEAHMRTFNEKYFGPSSTLDQLLQIAEVKIKEESTK